MKVELELVVAPGIARPPAAELLRHAATAALDLACRNAADRVQLSVRIIDEAESRALNAHYRGRDHATNVLSFPAQAELPGLTVLGDLAVCAAVVEREAAEQDKTAAAHWTHMLVHGVLHLLGYDHIDDDEADIMETLERRILARLGHADPYASAI